MVYSNYFHVFCSSISIVGKVFLSPKEISDIIERKKQFTSKVMDALIKFSRHLLRTNDIDGETLMFDVLGSKFCFTADKALFKVFQKLIYLWVLVDLLMGIGETDLADCLSRRIMGTCRSILIKKTLGGIGC